MLKYCILQLNKPCTNCGDCNKCDLNSSKICNNCGKCLKMEGYDSKAIGIDEILEENLPVEEDSTSEECSREELIEKYAKYNSNLKNKDIKIEYIDDIDGLNEVLGESEDEKKSMKEVFPGLFVFDNDEGE
ncbi:hypothetical protein RBU49_07065 [Clostridium sp. MB40-C1]|uniref:hypothetical protein n=1 Tax=Clostridium sp. MB40-C1 TaxID=3070996 RepID=UPI0027DEC774|nr:hypothetical protein [Clostridium sp. MB40-C1]WMJ82003.1 hypothetical protein RBU49_07065 [Clostridium sp. MB40-C1]